MTALQSQAVRDTRRTMRAMGYRLKSEWADAKASELYAEAQAIERTPPRNGNYARRREEVAELRRQARQWTARAARYRAEEARRAA